MLTGAVCPVSRASPRVFHGCFIVNEFSTRYTQEYEKSTDSVRGQLFQAKSQPNSGKDSFINKRNKQKTENSLVFKGVCIFQNYIII